MKYQVTLLAVSDIERSKEFYKEWLGLDVVNDFGANVELTGGISLQTAESWREFIGGREVSFRHNSVELYFEEDDFDDFVDTLDGLELVHPPFEHRWGQRVVRFYDPDGHIIEVGENMASVVRRFQAGGMTVSEIAARMGVPEDYVRGKLQASLPRPSAASMPRRQAQ